MAKASLAPRSRSCQIICPRHGARFDLRTGEALTPPAYEPMRTFNVRRGERPHPRGAALARMSMRLTLVSARERGVEGRQRAGFRPAAEQARAQLKPRRSGSSCSSSELVPDLLLTSPARRTQQTAEILARRSRLASHDA